MDRLKSSSRCLQHSQRCQRLHVRTFTRSSTGQSQHPPTPAVSSPTVTAPPSHSPSTPRTTCSTTPRHPIPALLPLETSTLHSYSDTISPNQQQLKAANQYFISSVPKFLWSTAHFRDFPATPFPEVTFLGRSNVGKSSVLNALFGRTRHGAKTVHVSGKPGRTRTMNAFGVGSGDGNRIVAGATEAWKGLGAAGVVVVDMPGYGAASREEWGREILKYLTMRKQLRRTFVLVDAEHGLKESDRQLISHLSGAGITHQIVLSKVDKILFPSAKAPSALGLSKRLLRLRTICDDIRAELPVSQSGRRAPGTLADILCCSAEKELVVPAQAHVLAQTGGASGGGGGGPKGKIGIDALRFAVLSACGVS